MVSMSIPLSDSEYQKLEIFSWVNWSEVARIETSKKSIFEEFIKTGTLSEENQKFCDKIFWYPIDWLEVKDEYVEKLKKRSKKPALNPITLEEFNKRCDSL